MQSKLPMHQVKRCRAKSKRSDSPCGSPAVKGSNVCRMHGARGGAPKGNRNAFKHGMASALTKAEAKLMRELLQSSQATLAAILAAET
jgi:glucans biosynthesis protein